MKLSIIVPVYNSENYLNKCVDSLINQKNFTDYEIILVDDCSTDSSYCIMHQYEIKNRNLIKTARTPENLRQGGARNLGISMASGEYISFVDSDDYIEETAYAKLFEDIHNEDLIYVTKFFRNHDKGGGEIQLITVTYLKTRSNLLLRIKRSY